MSFTRRVIDKKKTKKKKGKKEKKLLTAEGRCVAISTRWNRVPANLHPTVMMTEGKMVV